MCYVLTYYLSVYIPFLMFILQAIAEFWSLLKFLASITLNYAIRYKNMNNAISTQLHWFSRSWYHPRMQHQFIYIYIEWRGKTCTILTIYSHSFPFMLVPNVHTWNKNDGKECHEIWPDARTTKSLKKKIVWTLLECFNV